MKKFIKVITIGLIAIGLIADIVLFWPGTIVDFATNAIYKPQQKSRK